MYKFTRDFLEYLADNIQIHHSKPNYGVWVYKKDHKGEYYPAPITFGPEHINIEMDRRYNMSADELTLTISNINGVFSPDYTTKKQDMFTNIDTLHTSGYQQALTPFNKLKVDLGYGTETMQVFIGQITSIDIDENQSTIKVTCQNEIRKLLKPIDPIDNRVLTYENMRAIEVVKDLCKRAGIEELTFEIDEVEDKDYSIPKAEFELGVSYKDAIDSILSTMGHRIYADRLGLIRIVKFERYNQDSITHWDFDDYLNLTQGSYLMDSAGIRNRAIVQSRKEWEAFEDPELVKFCNGEKIAMGVEVPWAETHKQRLQVANDLFLQMRRKFRRITLATIGNPAMDVGDLADVRMLTSTATAKYMITGIKSSFTDAGYFDIVDLEFVVNEDAIVAEKAEGDYTPPPIELPDNIDDPLAPPAPPPTTVGSVAGVTSIRDAIVQESRRHAANGTPYIWGGGHGSNLSVIDNARGYDCSGLVSLILRKFGLMPKNRPSMVADGLKKWCTQVANPTPGDLVFYSNSSGYATHVGIFLGNGQTMSASGGGSSTTSVAIARRQNAKAKIHRTHYDRRVVTYGTPPTYATAAVTPSRQPLGPAMVVEATAYTSDPAENGGWTVTALGTPLKYGIIAVDPSVIPLRTRVYITHMDGTPMGTFRAEDTGGAIKGRKIDILLRSKQEARNFGRRNMKVYILR